MFPRHPSNCRTIINAILPHRGEPARPRVASSCSKHTWDWTLPVYTTTYSYLSSHRYELCVCVCVLDAACIVLTSTSFHLVLQAFFHFRWVTPTQKLSICWRWVLRVTTTTCWGRCHLSPHSLSCNKNWMSRGTWWLASCRSGSCINAWPTRGKGNSEWCWLYSLAGSCVRVLLVCLSIYLSGVSSGWCVCVCAVTSKVRVNVVPLSTGFSLVNNTVLIQCHLDVGVGLGCVLHLLCWLCSQNHKLSFLQST